jgi:hypothetical protein
MIQRNHKKIGTIVTYNNQTIYPFKYHYNVVNHHVSSIQFGDLTYFESPYTDFGIPPSEQEKKIAPAFTMSHNQAYAFSIQSPILSQCYIVSGRQSLDFLDNTDLGELTLN